MMAKKKKKAAPAKIKFQKLVPPLTDKDITPLRAGDRVLITGIIFVARDSAHKIFDKRPPFNIKGAIIYYASPTPTRKGKVIGSIGPTTSARMDPYKINLLKLGLKATIGKGRRSEEVKAAMKKHKAVYFVVPGGTAAVLSKHVKQAKILAYPDLGPEAVLELEVHDFPAIVAIDSKGGDLFEQGKKRYACK